MSYENFAYFYDSLQTDVDYEGRADYLLRIFRKYDRLPTLVLDVACGTGGFTLPFLKNGIDVIGVDPSPEMLNIAREKLCASGYNALLLCQSAEELDLYGTVDGAVCCLDSLNHIIDAEELKRSIARIALFLEKDRLFIFDVNTEYKHKNVLSEAVFTAETEDCFCVWRNSECSSEGVVDISLDFFKENENGTYTRTFEDFSERAYSVEYLNDCVTAAGLETVAILGDMSMEAPTCEEQRIIFVTRRI